MNCPDCGVRPGEWHRRGCDVEQCPRCGGQLARCQKDNGDAVPLGERLPWAGYWPGEDQCRQWGWFARPTPDGWRRCRPDHPDASPDLNRLREEAAWDRRAKRYRQVARRRGGR
jgi:hypothetical protein